MSHDDSVYGALVQPDGHLLSWSWDQTLRQWDAKTGAQIGPAMRHDDLVLGALVQPDGHLLSWSFDNTLRQWDAKTGEQVGPAMRHDKRVVGALVQSEGRLLSWSDALRQWDAKTGQQIGPAMRHDGWIGVEGALVQRDGRPLSWSGDGTVRQWNVNWPAGSIFAVACALLPDKEMADILDRFHLERSEPICRSPQNIPLPDWSKIERVSD